MFRSPLHTNPWYLTVWALLLNGYIFAFTAPWGFLIVAIVLTVITMLFHLIHLFCVRVRARHGPNATTGVLIVVFYLSATMSGFYWYIDTRRPELLDARGAIIRWVPVPGAALVLLGVYWARRWRSAVVGLMYFAMGCFLIAASVYYISAVERSGGHRCLSPSSSNNNTNSTNSTNSDDDYDPASCHPVLSGRALQMVLDVLCFTALLRLANSYSDRAQLRAVCMFLITFVLGRNAGPAVAGALWRLFENHLFGAGTYYLGTAIATLTVGGLSAIIVVGSNDWMRRTVRVVEPESESESELESGIEMSDSRPGMTGPAGEGAAT